MKGSQVDYPRDYWRLDTPLRPPGRCCVTLVWYNRDMFRSRRRGGKEVGHTETVVETRRLFQGRVLKLRVDRVRLEGGVEATREVVEHPGAVAVVAVDQQRQVVLVRQYRHPVGQPLDELPAGKLEPGEDPLLAAQRELEEETGLLAGSWREIGDFFTAPGFADERMRLYLALDLRPGQVHPDADEDLQTFRLNLRDAARAATEGRFHDAKTLAGLLLADRLLEEAGR